MIEYGQQYVSSSPENDSNEEESQNGQEQNMLIEHSSQAYAGGETMTLH